MSNATLLELAETRNLALEKIKAANRKLHEHCAGQRHRLAEKYYGDVLSCFRTFEDLLIQYALKAKKTMDDEDIKAMFFEASEVVDVAETTYATYLDQVQAREDVNKRESEEAERKAREKATWKKMKNKITSEFDEVLSSSLDLVGTIQPNSTNKPSKLAILDEITYLEKRMDANLKLVDDYTSLVHEEEATGTMALKNKVERDFRSSLRRLKTYASDDTESAGGLGSRANTPGSGRSSRRQSPDGLSFKYKKMEFPKFTGILRQYATFKRDFQDVVSNPGCFDERQMSLILRNECLSGEAKSLVHNIHDYTALWEKLDEKYDDEAEVVEQITRQITNLKKLEEEDYNGLVKLVDTLEKANLDLTAMGSTAVLSNPMTVRLVMTKCPKTIREGVMSELSGKKQEEEFSVMLRYLVAKRKDGLRLARLKEDGKQAGPQGKQRGAVHATDGRQDDPGGKKGGWSCPVGGCGYKQKHFMSECRTFKKLSLNDKGKLLLAKSLCVLCFGPHQVSSCPKKTAGWKECDIGGCGRWHSRMIHGASVPGLVLLGTATGEGGINGKEATRALLLVQKIQTTNQDCTTFWDPGATISLVTNTFADAAGLDGADCCFELGGVGDSKESFSTKLYMVPLVDRNGRTHLIEAFGIPRITRDLTPVNLEEAAADFGIESEKLERPVGKVDLLIGVDNIDIMPVRVCLINKMALYTSKFGTGYLVGGSMGVSEGDQAKEELNGYAQTVCHAEAKTVIVDFFTAEGFGVDIPRRCKNCKGCQECGFKAEQLTWTEAMELAQIEKGLTLDAEKKVWTASYPYKVDPSILKDNYSQAYACMASLEKRLIKNKQLDAFNAQFNDNVVRGVFKKISKEEAHAYTGPVNYVTITEAYKDGEQTTTPLRLCMNSSMKFQGVSLNDLLMKGPSALNNIYSVLLNFRSYPVGFVKDLSKFYQSVLASERDQHLRRVIWRDGDTDAVPKIYVTSTVNFGDKPAGCVALTAVRETADLYRNIDEDAADKLKRDNYCDDVASGAEDKDKAHQTSANMDKIVEKGGFIFKSTVMSGDEGPPRKVLGTGWDTKEDTLFVEVKVNVSPKRKGVRMSPDIEFKEIQERFPAVITKRIIWRVVLGQFDLLGLACIFFIRLKLLMRDLSGEEGQKIGWDDPVADEIRDRFVSLLEMMAGIQSLRFPRCITPVGRKDKLPELLCFGDGSKQAFCSLAYIRWEMEDDTYKLHLVSGKTRVAPMKKISVPRLELLGAVASVRLAQSVQESLSIKFGRRYFFTDSSSVLGMIRGDCGAFQEFVGTRTGEIKSKSGPEEWFWLPTDKNLADLGTRDDVTPADLHSESEYLNGMPWMRKDISEWPVNQKPGRVPEEEMSPAARTAMVTTITEPLIDLAHHSSYSKVIDITAIAFQFVNKQHGPAKAKYKEMAENFWLVNAQEGSVMKEFKAGKLSTLKPKLTTVKVLNKDKEIVVTSGRLGKALIVGYDKEELPILHANHPVSRLIMEDAHAIEHSGVDRTLWRSRCTVWIINGRRLAKVIGNNCFRCKLLNKRLEKQVMAPLPESRVPPAPVFDSTAVDLFGPLEIRDTVKKRTTKKCWGVIFCCTVTSAIHLEVAEDYSCDSFLLCLRRFCNLRGTPKRFQSDPGSQLMAAATVMAKWDFGKIHEWLSKKRSEWHFAPADSQHYNGCAESMIKTTKKQLSLSLGVQSFTKGELDTLMSNVTFIVNSRPIMKRAGEDPLSGGPITPLHLIGGRCTLNVPTVDLDESPRLTKRLQFIENTTNEFWQKWFQQVFHDLVPSYRWKTTYRNVMEGDIVLLKDSNLLKREYRLARVKEAVPGDDGKVRRVKLEYKNLKSTGKDVKDAVKDLQKPFTEVVRSVQNVVVIVPADWKEEDIEKAVTSGIRLK